ncbi:ketohydroxyglutarate aldolase [Geobacillus sp. PA-3]|uniref:bifunctional 2-keto-4-hydroxyglutarate aldolase/2-keto-3-deoxy-6-phosphogluconate aldolase n=1 Tax=Geobacillus sp. PA-3 TaxID=1699078 RepID=UPI0006E527BD|nr:bifunctional 2-keto-4-hydroxyglutarate aldolase/2-keto-3-deoxy-6-phosphogluconate aldolase [Geobacillus sp. PA-3]KQB91634.1 ketohydroxyglutarate aldolase [Geobacillus sp. PA-3]
MNTKYETLTEIAETKVVAVIRGRSAKEAMEIAKAVADGGIQVIEMTYTTPNVRKVFEMLTKESNILLGAGTVLDAETARLAILEGAKFIVSPHLNRDIATVCNRYSIPYLPGCMTINEIVQALECGSDVIKLFPSSLFHPSIIRAINGPLPNVRVMPTGGVNLTNLKEWLGAGALAVGVGSDLTKAYDQGGCRSVIELSRKYVELVS